MEAKPYISPKDRKYYKYFKVNGKWILYPKNSPYKGSCI